MKLALYGLVTAAAVTLAERLRVPVLRANRPPPRKWLRRWIRIKPLV